MRILTVQDAGEVSKVLNHPDIYEAITGDNGDAPPPMDEHHVYLGAYVDGEIVGLAIFHPYRDGVEGHFQVLPEHRKAHAEAFAKAILNMVDVPIYGLVPTLYPNVIAFNKKMGARVVGTLANHYTKHGVAYDVIITRFN
ncbi:hypothetical protein LJ739_06730 [Aestuariibacter halophilus]|uniref:N-acetyltransferase domain-containing protein n=1 Tax=Fluctibacter halophilus TaxID=226011 RepID=A0ABS8G9N6_9ALTE|nr:hypothetical protein [Aestuariibacter halophilus]MCC2615931.1 hypothetical protein [Aestuariibacter halophilus]